MSGNGVVSLIVPCYGVANWIGRMLESVCSQTYRPIELIVVDDGSRDGLAEVVKSWEGRLRESGIQYQFLHQPNGGVSAAINTGLKKCHGEFLSFPDPDDALTPDSVEKRVAFLRDNPRFASVTSDAYIVPENDLTRPVGKVSGNNPRRFDERQFELLLHEQSIFCPLCHLIRAEVFWETHPSGQIYPSRYGQNWQILLPIYYHYSRGFLDEPLGYYTLRNGSLSKGDDSLEKCVTRQKAHLDIQMHTLTEMEIPQPEREKFLRESRIHFARKLLTVGRRYGDKALLQEQKAQLRALGAWSMGDAVQYAAGGSRAVGALYQALTRPLKWALKTWRNKL